MIRPDIVDAEKIRRLPTAMMPEHLVLTLALILAGYVLCGWPEGSPDTAGNPRYLYAWDGAPLSENARVVRLEGDIARPGIYVVGPGERLYEVLPDAGVRGSIPRSLPGDIHSGTVLVLRSENGKVRVAGVRDMSPVEKLILGLPLNINTVDAEGLAQVPGIGPYRAEKIIAERERRGGFEKMVELESVPGIGSGIRKTMERYLQIVQTSSSHREIK